MSASAARTASRTVFASSVLPVSCCSALSSRIGMIGRRADADGDAFAFAVGAQLDLRRRRDEGKIAAPRIHLVKADADPLPCQTGKRTPVRQAPAGRLVIIGPTKKSRAGMSVVLPPAR